MKRIRVTAPAKAILCGEHAVNRGQAALAVSIGLYATCQIDVAEDAPRRSSYTLQSGTHLATTTPEEILDLGKTIDCCRDAGDYGTIQRITAEDFFAPAKYVLAAVGSDLPHSLAISFTSEIPRSAGLGSGGAAFVALATAMAALLGCDDDQRLIARWAHRGDIVAHGGIASGLDTQTSLYGGALRYTAEREGEPVPYSDGLALVIGNSGVFAATSAVNERVRGWLAERPVRLHYFQEIGLLSRMAEVTLRDGDWAELGRLLNLNQLLLERIGISCPEIEALNEAALTAGALGAKVSGSGGGGIMIALVSPDSVAPVAKAISAAGGTPIVAPIGVPGARVHSVEV